MKRLYSKVKEYLNTHRRLKNALVLFLIITIVLILYFGREGIKQEEPVQIVATPTPRPEVDNRIDPLVPLRVFPEEGEISFAGSKNSIAIFFDTEVDPRTVKITTEPSIKLVPKILADNPDRLVLVPQTYWKAGVSYKITIEAGIQARLEPRTTRNKIELEYKTQYPPSPIPLPPKF